MNKSLTKVGVVFGGVSSEHNVSIKSAKTIVSALRGISNKNKFEVINTYIDKKGRWWTGAIAEEVLNKGLLKELEERFQADDPIGLKILNKDLALVDIWFPVLHGPNGEDGSIQGLFQLTGKPFVGSGILGSAIGMDKIAMKTIFTSVGLPQAPYLAITDNDFLDKEKHVELITQIESSLGYPCFIKPANLGSSLGITKAYSSQEASLGLKLAATFDKRIVIEKSIKGKELECAVLGKKNLKASTVGEVSFGSDWYDYETKYSTGLSKALIPAPIPEKIVTKVQELSLLACKAISAEGLARVDFFFNEKENQLWVNEINTLPGFTKQSMYPMLWKESGINLDELVAILVETAKE